MSYQGAQPWKPQRLVGSAQLSIFQIDAIVLPESASKSLVDAVTDFSNLIQRVSGRSVQVLSGGRPKNAIYFQLTADLSKGGAFTIRRKRTRVYILSGEPAGWSNALYAIGKEMLGARYYWAGDLGLEFVKPSFTHFPNRPWRETPAFVQRKFYPVNTDFARRNRLNQVYSFNHNLAKVFNEEIFITKPEVFSKVNGQRKVPRRSSGTDPQPDLTHPKAIEVAAQAALSHFEDNPNSKSFSLSINDNVLFDTTERTEAAVSPLRYFRTRPNYTDLVFGFMNQVARLVFDEGGAWQTPTGEDRYLTALSYYWAEPAPTIMIHPRVMPVLTSDRAQWHDPDYRTQDKALIQAWAASGAERVATWDYYFGAPHLHPRQFNQWIIESIRHMSDEGIDVFFSQLPSFWGLDGAKAWFAAELLWNPEQDALALLDEYYDNFFGPAAASIRAFYETAERHRNENEGQADWIKLYKDESGIALFTPKVLAEMRGYIDLAEAKLGVPPKLDASRFQKRVQVVSEAFRLTELSADFDQSRRALVQACFNLESSVNIETLLAQFKIAASDYRAYFEDYTKNAYYSPERRRITLNQSNPERLASGLIKPEPREFISQLRDPKLKHVGKRMRNFLGPLIPQVEDWHIDYRASEHFVVKASETSVGDDSGLRVLGTDIISIFGTFPVVSNHTYELRMKSAWKISLDNRAHIHVTWLDSNGRNLETELPLRLPIEHRAKPVVIRLPFTSPNEANDVRLRIVVS
ncbi:MAG: DUF4838 domain-containing protein, partial [Verrucomicrobiota bacterium]|nr:DUF4838 domain-containing protein [Verrucomicrobiota bacterium]